MLKVAGIRAALAATCGAAALVAASAPASAGGFAVREQSTEFQGSSWAGDAAAGGGLSGMFWNPAVAASAPKGYSSESDATGIYGHVTEEAQPGSTGLLVGLPASSGNIAPPALVPGSYMAYRIDPSTVFALSVNSPFGLTTKVGKPWAGQTLEQTSVIKTYDYVPTVAVTVAPGLSVGAGLQIERIEAHLTSETLPFGNPAGVPPSTYIGLDGSDTSYGFTLGANWSPSAATSIGLGYRSAVSQNLSGTQYFKGLPLSDSVNAGLTLPEIVTLSLRQSVASNARLLGTVEWTGWHRLSKLSATCNDAGAFCPTGSGAPSVGGTFPLNWHDGWMYSLGGEFDASKQLMLRSGLAYEISPIQNPSERTPRLPDQNRLWLSGGASYQLSDMIGLDLAYSHIFGLGGDINYTAPNAGTLVANVKSSVDIISGAVKFKLNP